MIKSLFSKRRIPYLIAEIGFNHEGDMVRAIKMIKEAKDAGADAVKFQSFNAEDILLPNTGAFANLKKCELSIPGHKLLSSASRKIKIDFISTPYSVRSVDLLEEIGVGAYKIASMDLNNFELLERVARTKKPIFISTGMATLVEIKQTTQLLRRLKGGPFVMLHCVSKYPTPINEVDLRLMNKIGEYCSCSVGYSDHSVGIFACLMSAVLGAAVIEKHFTLDNKRKGADHYHSATPLQLKELISQIKLAYRVMGDLGDLAKRTDRGFARLYRRGIFANCYIPKGKIISRGDLILCRPETRLAPVYLKKITGKRAKRAIHSFSPLTKADF